jgi:mono/diheme cytochrome c family protein
MSPPRLRRALTFTAVLIGLAAADLPLHAQSASPPFTAAQAARGGQAYQSKCQGCHGKALEGSDSGPPLAGGFFASQWGGAPAGDLFDVIATTMPASRPGTLAPSETADIVAYILCSNGAPAGPAPLSTARTDLEIKIPAESKASCAVK